MWVTAIVTYLKKIIIIIKGTAHGEMQKFNGDTIVINQMKAGEVLASAFLFGKNNKNCIMEERTESRKELY